MVGVGVGVEVGVEVEVGVAVAVGVGVGVGVEVEVGVEVGVEVAPPASRTAAPRSNGSFPSAGRLARAFARARAFPPRFVPPAIGSL